MTVINDFEDMPSPKGDKEFASWLVPARNNIQRELLRLQQIIGAPPAKKERGELYTPDPPKNWEILGYLLGAGFSLWRAVFQSGHKLETRENFGAGQIFLDEIVRNNAAMYLTELNSWSLGYYVNNARFRLVDAFERSPSELKTNSDLKSRVDKLHGALNTLEQSLSSSEWENCFHALRLLIDAHTQP